jgi:VIT1/CCC1 family predicted Fe2+/Mn2+ transporter
MDGRPSAKTAIRQQMVSLVTAAFAFVAALFWNDAIKSMITSFIPAQGAWTYLVVAATIVTVFCAIVIYVVTVYVGDGRR